MKKMLLVLIFLTAIQIQAEVFFTPQMISSHLKSYSEEEILEIKKDLNVVRDICLENIQNTENKFYLATAGAPGARKTTILERFVSMHPEYQKGVYLDPDPRALKFMVHTYYAKSLNYLTISSSNNYDDILKNAYEKWRPGSNYIALVLLEEAFEAGSSVIHGTTSTGGHIPDFLARLKENNYEIILLLCSCPEEVRYEAINYRNRVIRFYQSSPEDAIAKGILFPQKMESYFAYADKMYFFWSDSLFANERLAGVWSNGELEVHDDEAMQCFIDKYEQDRAHIEGPIPSFDSFLKKNTDLKN